MPIPSELITIVNQLTQLTHQRKVNWREGSTKWVFLASIRDFSVRLADVGEEDETLYTFAILDSEGLDIDVFHLNKSDPDFSQLKDLWKNARRQVFHIDDAIRGIESQLEDLLTEATGLE